MTAMARPNPAGREAGKDSYDDDPLVELARIVSGRAKSSDAPQQSAFREDSGMTEADLARDLETELLNDLQATFADGDDETAEYYEQPAAYSDEQGYDEPAGPAYGYEGQGYDEPDDAPGYQAQEPGADLPPLPGAGTAEHDFSHFNLRNDPGPAYNPHSLSAEEYAEDYGDDEPAAPSQEYADDFAEEEPAPRQQYADDFAEEEPLLDPAREIEQASAFPEDDTFADPADWDFDPHPHVAEVAAGTAEPSYFDNADVYDRDETAPVAPTRAQARHRDPRLDADPLGQARYRRRRGIRLFPILGVLMIIGLGAAFVLVFRSGGTTPEPVQVAADPSPTRVFPEPDPAPAEPENLVFNRLNPDAPPPDETLLEPTEPVADIAATPEANDGITQILTPTDPATADAVDLPRMVRTVTVLTDGTIVENETAPAEGAAPAAELPADEPATAPPADPIPADTDPIAVAAIDPPAVEAPAPAVVPTEAVAPPPAAPQVVANLPRAGDPIAPGYYVQVTAQASEQAAQTQLQDFRARAPSLLGTRPAIIQRAELEQGIFYRVKFGPFADRSEAVTLVENLRAIGMDGFIADHR